MSPEQQMYIAVRLLYTNWKGETAWRRIIPNVLPLYFGHTEYHQEDQWLLRCWDVHKGDYRTYAMKDIHLWLTEEQYQALRSDPEKMQAIIHGLVESGRINPAALTGC